MTIQQLNLVKRSRHRTMMIRAFQFEISHLFALFLRQFSTDNEFSPTFYGSFTKHTHRTKLETLVTFIGNNNKAKNSERIEAKRIKSKAFGMCLRVVYQ